MSKTCSSDYDCVRYVRAHKKPGDSLGLLMVCATSQQSNSPRVRDHTSQCESPSPSDYCRARKTRFIHIKMHPTTSNVAVNQSGSVGFAPSVSTDLKQSPDTDTPSNAAMTRPTILDKTKRQLIDAVTKNRLTIVIGPTGCGE